LEAPDGNGLDTDLQEKILFIYNDDDETLKKILLAAANSSVISPTF
jgi:hypothetical protein